MASVDVDKIVDASADRDADHLLDQILRNALGVPEPSKNTDIKGEGVKGEGVKGEGVKGEGVKDEGVKNEGVKGENVKNEVKAENVKGERVKAEIKSEHVKGEHPIKREPIDAPALGDIEKRDRSRGKKKRSRSGKKKRSRSGGKKKKKRKHSSSSRSASKSPVASAMQGLPQARVVAVRGHWAQYLSPAGETFYKNVLSGEVQWQKPGNFDCQPSRRAGEMTPAPGEAACYIFHMPPEWSEADLMQLFAPFGQVTSAHVQRDANGFSRSCGFVTYAAADHANQACNMMNGFGIDGKMLKVSLTQFSLGTVRPPGT